MIIQIYEIQTEYEAELVLASGIDHVGSVILSDTHWKDPKIRSAIQIIQAAGKKSSLIPLFSDITTIGQCLDYYQPDIVHFCESIAAASMDSNLVAGLIETQKKIRQRFPEIQIMRSVPIFEPGQLNSDSALALVQEFEPYSDYFLTDTVISAVDGKTSGANQPVAGFVGITGRTCDWSTAAKLVLQSKIPVILAGGLGPENVTEAILKVKPFGVDSCTATNALDAAGKSIRFRKDPEKVRLFVRAARSAEALAES